MKIKYLVIVLLFSFAGCRKNDNPVTEKPVYSGPPMVNFNNYISDDDYWGYLKKNIDIVNEWVDISVEVRLANTLEPAKIPVRLNIIKSDVHIYDYNTQTGNLLTPVPVNAIKMEQKEVVIQRGAHAALYTFQVNPGLLNLSGQNAVGLSIAEVTSGNAVLNDDEKQTRLVVELGTLNAYDGIYRMSNYFFHPTNPDLTGIQNYEPVHMVSSGSNSVDSYVNTSSGLFPTQLVYSTANAAGSFFTGVNPRFIINATTNAVTLGKAVSTSADFIQDAGEMALSKYYPTGITGYSAGKKTIVAHFKWQSGGPGTERVCRDTFVYVGPR